MGTAGDRWRPIWKIGMFSKGKNIGEETENTYNII
jgi:hypothetical protein